MNRLHHIALTAGDLGNTKKFYNEILPLIGYQLHYDSEKICTWVGAEPEILIYQAKEELKGNVHETYSSGLHHLAFTTTDRETVNQIYQKALDLQATILDAPSDYPDYAEGYYAVYFNDPDGMKLEFAHIPNSTH